MPLTITQKAACCGCGACAATCPKQCIALKADSEGFWYPEVNMDLCIDCGLCEMHCPELHTEQKLQAEPVAYAVQHRVDEVRGNSSSGGVFYALASEIIHHGGTVFGAAFREDFSVAHCGISDINDLPQLMRSKYVQSEIGATYREVEALLKNGKQVLFTGTPCQISGLTRYLGEDYDTLISAAVACHGVPSPKVWKQCLSEKEEEFHSSVTAMNFRNKETGWKNYSVSFTFENGKVYQKPFSEDGYMLSFLLNYNLRPSCYSCKWKGLPPQADLMLADFWGIENVLPEMDHPMGTSLVLAVTEKGKVLLRAVEKNLKMVSVPVEAAVSGNSAITEPARLPQRRDVFWQTLQAKSVSDSVRAASQVPLWRRAAGKLKRMLVKP